MRVDRTCILIGERAAAIAARFGVELDAVTTAVMIEDVHRKTPLRLQALLEADDFNFVHDVFGIRKHYDAATGAIDNRFLPRFAVKGGMR